MAPGSVRCAIAKTLTALDRAQCHQLEHFLPIEGEVQTDPVPAEPASSWRWAGLDWPSAVHTDVVSEITAVELQDDHPRQLAERWGRILNRPVAVTPAGIMRIVLDRGAIRFVEARDGRGTGLSAIDVAVGDRQRLFASAQQRHLPVATDSVEIGGIRVYVGAMSH